MTGVRLLRKWLKREDICDCFDVIGVIGDNKKHLTGYDIFEEDDVLILYFDEEEQKNKKAISVKPTRPTDGIKVGYTKDSDPINPEKHLESLFDSVEELKKEVGFIKENYKIDKKKVPTGRNFLT